MTNNSNIQKGSMLIDLIIALFLGSLFIAIIANNTHISRNLFEKAKTRLSNIALFEDNALSLLNAIPNQVLAIGTTTNIRSRNYGNDFYLNTLDFGSGTTSLDNFVFIRSKREITDSNSVSNPFINPAINPATNLAVPVSSVGFCSANYLNSATIGSFDRYTGDRLLGLDDMFEHIPVSMRKIHLPVDPTFNPTSLVVRNGIAYVSFDSANAGDPDLIIFDTKSDEANIVGEINTGPGLVDFVLVGKYIYAVAPSQVGQVHIIEQLGQDSLALKSRYKLPLPYATATPPLGSAITFSDDQLFVGTQKWLGDEFNIIDIRDREVPVKTFGYEIDSKVNDILVSNSSTKSFVYVSASNINQLLALDISGVDPILVSVFSPEGWQRQEGKAISIFEDSLKFGRTSGGFDLLAEHEYFDFASTSTTTLSSFVSTNYKGGVYDIIQDQNFSYIISRENNKEFWLIRNSHNDEPAPLGTSTSMTVSLPIVPESMTCDQDKIYIIAKQAPFIYELSVSLIK